MVTNDQTMEMQNNMLNSEEFRDPVLRQILQIYAKALDVYTFKGADRRDKTALQQKYFQPLR